MGREIISKSAAQLEQAREYQINERNRYLGDAEEALAAAELHTDDSVRDYCVASAQVWATMALAVSQGL